jgi:hypothetical protein
VDVFEKFEKILTFRGEDKDVVDESSEAVGWLVKSN